MEWLGRLILHLTEGVSLAHPGVLVVIFIIGAISELGFPLFFAIETFLFFASYDHGPLSSEALLLVAMLLGGREAGSMLLYAFTRILGAPFVDWMERHLRWFSKAVERFKEHVNRQPVIAVVLGRLTPGLLQVPTITAGMIRLSPGKFAAGVAISSLIYDFILILLGYSARFALPHLQAGPRAYLFIGFFLLIAVVWIVLFLAFRRGFSRK